MNLADKKTGYMSGGAIFRCAVAIYLEEKTTKPGLTSLHTHNLKSVVVTIHWPEPKNLSIVISIFILVKLLSQSPNTPPLNTNYLRYCPLMLMCRRWHLTQVTTTPLTSRSRILDMPADVPGRLTVLVDPSGTAVGLSITLPAEADAGSRIADHSLRRTTG